MPEWTEDSITIKTTSNQTQTLSNKDENALITYFPTKHTQGDKSER